MKQFYTYFYRIVLLLLFLVSTVKTTAQIIPDGDYVIFNSTISESITTDTTAPFEAFMAPLDVEDPFQIWSFTHQSDDIYIINNTGSNTTLGINDGWCGVFGDVRAGFAETDANVEFRVSPAATDNRFVLEIAFTECNFGSVNDPIKAFDIEGGAPGAQVQTFDVDTTNPNQQFQITDVTTLSVNQINPTSSLRLFYNQNQRVVALENTMTVENIRIYNLNGQIISSQRIAPSSTTTVEVPFNDKANGLYLMQIEGSNQTITKKVLIY